MNEQVSFGLFYFGKNSIPFKVDNTTYQIKCLQRIYHTTKDFRCVYLQFTLSDDLTLEMLNEFQTEYMKVSDISYFTTCGNVIIVKKFEKPKLVKQNKYDAILMNRIFYRPNNLKEQTKAAK